MIGGLKLALRPKLCNKSTAACYDQPLSRYYDTCIKKSCLRYLGRGGPSLISHYLAAGGVLA